LADLSKMTDKELEQERDRRLDAALALYPNAGEKFWEPVFAAEREMTKRNMKLGL